ncbi:hypothetical protein LOK49_LG10G02195 [Camellia lanceoleosa]|uniref:Uncharacterized protein n=1 Tax=Camellia lanceoleosa TaxID=1840588 RepID=A0ACC0GAK2_9ERIC|nr:hypothetical protein LOK49_LG10G02195 [Camellia lanceoleosa]
MFTSIVGNVAGFKALHAVRLEDLQISHVYARTFRAPPHGIQVEKDILDKYSRPLLVCTIKPKLGLSAKNYDRIVCECLHSGLDLTKSDEKGDGEIRKGKRSDLDELHYPNNPYEKSIWGSIHDPKKLQALLVAFVGLFTNHNKEESYYKKLLALIVAFIGLFTNQNQDDEPHDYSGMAGQDPKDILTSLADLLGLSAEAHGDGTPSVKGSIEHH